MSIQDEARAKALKRHPIEYHSVSDEVRGSNPITSPERDEYEAGYIDGASRKPEVAPSDTDRADAHARYHDQAGNMLWENDCAWSDCKFWEIATFVASRTSQPVQVEVTEETFVSVGFDSGTTLALTGENAGHWVEGEPTHVPARITDDTVERAAKAYWVESEREVFPESPTGDWSAEERDRFMWAARIVLSSALGGGDHE